MGILDFLKKKEQSSSIDSKEVENVKEEDIKTTNENEIIHIIFDLVLILNQLVGKKMEIFKEKTERL